MKQTMQPLRSITSKQYVLLLVTMLASAACTSTREHAPTTNGVTSWAANGYLSPTPTAKPIIIGEFARKEDCIAAIEGWKATQVVGHPISADCLPIDRD